MGPSKILGGCDVRSQEFVPVQSCHISCQLAMSQSESAYSAIADWHWTNLQHTGSGHTGTLLGTWGHHNAEMGTCGRGDMLVRLGPGGQPDHAPPKPRKGGPSCLPLPPPPPKFPKSFYFSKVNLGSSKKKNSGLNSMEFSVLGVP